MTARETVVTSIRLPDPSTMPAGALITLVGPKVLTRFRCVRVGRVKQDWIHETEPAHASP